MEAVLLTGGASRRMGEDKSKLLVEGVPQARRIADALLEEGLPVTVLGREPLEGCGFVRDEAEFNGPLAALARFEPSREAVFVVSCDLPCFDPHLVLVLAKALGNHSAAVPEVNEWRQPLCALYRASAFASLRKFEANGKPCAMGWLATLDHVVVSEAQLRAAGIAPSAAQGANTRDELNAMQPGGRVCNP